MFVRMRLRKRDGAFSAVNSPYEVQIKIKSVGFLEVYDTFDDMRREYPGEDCYCEIDSESADVFIEPVFLQSEESGGRRRVEARGQVTVEGLVPEWNLVRVRPPGRAPQTLLTRLPPEGVVDASVKLGEGAVVFGTVRTADGAPAPGARIDIVGWEWAELGVVADAEGAYRMERAPAALVELRAAAADGAEARVRLRLEEGKGHAWDPVLQRPAEISGRVIDEGSAPVAQGIHRRRRDQSHGKFVRRRPVLC